MTTPDKEQCRQIEFLKKRIATLESVCEYQRNNPTIGMTKLEGAVFRIESREMQDCIGSPLQCNQDWIHLKMAISLCIASLEDLERGRITRDASSSVLSSAIALLRRVTTGGWNDI